MKVLSFDPFNQANFKHLLTKLERKITSLKILTTSILKASSLGRRKTETFIKYSSCVDQKQRSESACLWIKLFKQMKQSFAREKEMADLNNFSPFRVINRRRQAPIKRKSRKNDEELLEH